jgi:outer membrane protein assembly factor BamB
MRSCNTLVRAVAAAGALALAACGGSGAFGLTSDDNNPAKLAEAFAKVEAPPAGTPTNKTGKPLAFLIARPNKKKGVGKRLIAYDLQAKKELWTVESDVSSKVVVGTNFVAHREGDRSLVARDVATGKKLWSIGVGAGFVGVAADTSQVYYVNADKSGAKPVWYLAALSGASGEELWRAEAPGQLGVPAARGGLVFSPFLKQWLAILDADTGEQLTRIRGIDEEISFVRTTKEQVYFGSKLGVFLLDERAASGKRAQSTYGSAKLPEFVRAHYYWDAFDPVQAGYSAYDRNRILWRGKAEGDKLAFADGKVVVHTYRFFFGFDADDGTLAWAYNHPRVDVIGSAHLGQSIGFASMFGEIGALDPATGKRTYKAKVDARLLGATFDAEGWAPSEPGAGDGSQSTVAALASIARDRDARYNDVKRFAIAALASMPGEDVSRDLLALIQDPRTPPKIYEKAVESLVARKDPKGVPYLVAALSVKHDFIEGSKPKAVGVAARALAAMDGDALSKADRDAAVQALLAQLRAPETSMANLVAVVRALASIGGGGEIQPLRTFLLVYRTAPSMGSQVAVMSATIDALLAGGGAAERELVAFVAADPRTQQAVAEYASRALVATDKRPADSGEAASSN